MKIKGKTIHIDRFGKIDLVKMLSDIKKYDSDVTFKTMIEYNHINQNIGFKLDEIEDLKKDIDDLEREILFLNNQSESIYKENSHLVEEYDMKFNISKQNKKLSSGKIGVFWILNLKYKKSNKSIYLGSDKKVREIVNNELESNRKLSDDRLRSEIYDMCYDKLFELVKGRENLYDLKIKFEELI